MEWIVKDGNGSIKIEADNAGNLNARILSGSRFEEPKRAIAQATGEVRQFLIGRLLHEAVWDKLVLRPTNEWRIYPAVDDAIEAD